MIPDAQWVLLAVGLVLAGLVLRDVWRERRWTLAVRARLMVIAAFALVICWLHFTRPL
jgi:hypothetical protein